MVQQINVHILKPKAKLNLVYVLYFKHMPYFRTKVHCTVSNKVYRVFHNC